MKKRLLIIRSASFQQLDSNLPEIRKNWPDHQIILLTHEHSVRLAEKYRDISEIWIYPHRDGFDYFKPCDGLIKEKIDTALVLVTNQTGAGFNNVQLFTLKLQAKHRVICNMHSEFREITESEIRQNWLLDRVLRAVAVIPTIIVGVLGFAFAIDVWLFLQLKKWWETK
jgi:hypothetical protein